MPEGLDGVSLVPTLTGDGEQQQHEYLYWEHPGGGLRDHYRAARMGNWKALRNGEDAPLELYDLEQDLGETTNVAESNPEVAERLAAILDEAHSQPRPHFRKGWDPENE